MTTPFNLITGFLGSGKTSLLRHLMDGVWDKGRPGAVVGEYAHSDYDGFRLRSDACDVKVVTGTDGETGPDALLDRVRRMLDEGSQSRIFLETSGVVEASRLARVLREDEQLASQVQFGRTVTVVDGRAFDSHLEHFESQLRAQVELADLIAINHIEHVPSAKREEIKAWAQSVNPDAEVEVCYMGQIRKSLFYRPFDEGMRTRLLDAAPVDGSLVDFDWFLYSSDEICYDRLEFGHRLLNLPASIARFKGVLRCFDRVYGVNGLPGQLDWDRVGADSWLGQSPEDGQQRPWRGSESSQGEGGGSSSDNMGGRSEQLSETTQIALIGLDFDATELTGLLDEVLRTQRNR